MWWQLEQWLTCYTAVAIALCLSHVSDYGDSQSSHSVLLCSCLCHMYTCVYPNRCTLSVLDILFYYDLYVSFVYSVLSYQIIESRCSSWLLTLNESASSNENHDTTSALCMFISMPGSFIILCIFNNARSGYTRPSGRMLSQSCYTFVLVVARKIPS